MAMNEWPWLVGVAPGGTATYTFVAANPGTYAYEVVGGSGAGGEGPAAAGDPGEGPGRGLHFSAIRL